MRPKFSLRSGLICFLVASVWLGLQFPAHYGDVKEGFLDVTRGWPTPVYSRTHLLKYRDDERTKNLYTKEALQTIYGNRVRHVDGLGYIVDIENYIIADRPHVKWRNAVANFACAAFTALLCAWLVGWVLDRRRRPAASPPYK
jgi:hypothetical protein